MNVIKALKLPSLDQVRNKLPNSVEVVIEMTDSYLDELNEYKKKLKEILIENSILPKLQSTAERIFYKYPNANYIACIERICTEDDSGNCIWEDSNVDELVLPDLDFKKVDYCSDSDTEADVDDLVKLFKEAYPTLTFEKESDAYWYGRPTKYFGLNRNFEPVLISEYDESSGLNSGPTFELIKFDNA